MIFQTGMTSELAEVAFRSVVSGITATSTDPALQAGEPVILTSGTAGDGQLVIRAVTATNSQNNLWVGVAHDTIAHEKIGLAQCYGVDEDVRLLETITAAAGDILIPNIQSTATALTGRSAVATAAPLFATAASSNSGHLAFYGYAGLAVVLEAATAASATAGASTVRAHLRLL